MSAPRLPRPGGAALTRRLSLFALAAGLFVYVTVSVQSGHGLALHDSQWLHQIIDHRTGWVNPLAKAVTHLGTGPIVGGLLVVSAVLSWRRSRSLRIPVGCAVWLGLGLLVRLAINVTIARPRPPGPLHLVGTAGYAFPSGHTTTATIGYGVLAFSASWLVPRLRLLFTTTAVLVAGAVGLSRVYLGVHWPTDVLGGWSLGIAWLALGLLLIAALQRTGLTPARDGFATERTQTKGGNRDPRPRTDQALRVEGRRKRAHLRSQTRHGHGLPRAERRGQVDHDEAHPGAGPTDVRTCHREREGVRAARGAAG